MTKTELVENYTMEQLAEMVVNFNSLMDLLKYSENFLKSGLFENPTIAAFESKIRIMQHENDCLQSEVEKYRKAFEGTKKERDCQIAEYQKKIEELEKKSDFCFPEEPIKIADLMIHGWETSWDYKHLKISELRQIAEHLLVYCNNQKEDVNE